MEHPLSVGLAIDVFLTVKGREIPCESEILEIEEKTFAITPPKRKGVPIPLEGEQVLVQINQLNTVYTMPCHVEMIAPQHVLLAIPSQQAIRRVQRRKFLRVRTKLPCLVEKEGKDGEWAEDFDGIIVDISGGGCALAVTANVPKEKLLRLTMSLPEEGKVQLMGRVIRSGIINAQRGPTFQLSVEFQFISEVVRAKVIRYVFAVQRQMAWRAATDRATSPLDKLPGT